MNCRIFSKSLRGYIAGELSKDVSELMSKHMNKCEKCRKMYNEQLQIYKSIESMAVVSGSTFKSSRAEILLNVDRNRYGKSLGTRFSLFVKRNAFRCTLCAAAAAAILFFAIFGVNNLTNILPVRGDNVSSANRGGVIEPDKDKVYKNEKLGFSFTIKESWSGKYSIKEKEDGVYVYFKPTKAVQDGQGLFFCIVKKTSDDIEDHLDTVGNPRTFTAKGITYIVGGPTDVHFPPENEEFQQFVAMTKDIGDIVKTIKVN